MPIFLFSVFLLSGHARANDDFRGAPFCAQILNLSERKVRIAAKIGLQGTSLELLKVALRTGKFPGMLYNRLAAAVVFQPNIDHPRMIEELDRDPDLWEGDYGLDEAKEEAKFIAWHHYALTLLNLPVSRDAYYWLNQFYNYNDMSESPHPGDKLAASEPLKKAETYFKTVGKTADEVKKALAAAQGQKGLVLSLGPSVIDEGFLVVAPHQTVEGLAVLQWTDLDLKHIVQIKAVGAREKAFLRDLKKP